MTKFFKRILFLALRKIESIKNDPVFAPELALPDFAQSCFIKVAASGIGIGGSSP